MIMQKVYLLLRDNRQTGPFTIDELWQQNLQPGDLIWVESKSHAWTPLNEMFLTPYAEESAAPPASSQLSKERIERNRVPSEIPRPMSYEDKAEALRERALNFKPVVNFKRVESTDIPRDNLLPEEESIYFVDHRRDKYSRQAEMLTGGFFTILVIGGIFWGQKLIREKKDLPTSVSTQIIAGESNSAKAEKDTVRSAPFVQDSVAAPAITNILPVNTKPVTVKKRESSFIASTKLIIKDKPADTARKVDNDVGTTVLPPPVEQPEKKEITADPPKENLSGTEEKKKTLGQAIKGIFKKKKNREKEGNE